MNEQPLSLSRADRRKFEKAMRRAPRPTRQKPSRADLPLRLIPWNIHGVWAPLDRILAKLELDGTAEYSGGEPVLYDSPLARCATSGAGSESPSSSAARPRCSRRRTWPTTWSASEQPLGQREFS